MLWRLLESGCLRLSSLEQPGRLEFCRKMILLASGRRIRVLTGEGAQDAGLCGGWRKRLRAVVDKAGDVTGN